MPSQQEKVEQRMLELNKMIEKGRLVVQFEKTKMYKMLVEWINKECDIDRMLAALKDERDEGIGYIRFGKAELKQFKVWKRIGEKKQKELRDLVQKEDEHKG